MSDQFLKFCRLTCVGGSERGTCPCAGPTDCQMKDHPDFATWRKTPGRRPPGPRPTRYEIALESDEDSD